MRILYTCDNEGPALMSLETLLANFAKSGTADFYPDDIRCDLDGRGWYASVHQNGNYLIVNLDKLQLTPTPEGWDGLYAKRGRDMAKLEKMTFHQWLNFVSTDALTSPVGVVMTASGYLPHHTGGGCLAWQRLSNDGKTQMLVSKEDTLGTELKDHYIVGIYLETEDYLEDEVFGADAAVTWCHQALGALDIARKWVKRLGGAFHQTTRGRLVATLTAKEVEAYDTDMDILGRAPGEPQQYVTLALAEASR